MSSGVCWLHKCLDIQHLLQVFHASLENGELLDGLRLVLLLHCVHLCLVVTLDGGDLGLRCLPEILEDISSLFFHPLTDYGFGDRRKRAMCDGDLRENGGEGGVCPRSVTFLLGPGSRSVHVAAGVGLGEQILLVRSLRP